ncbi:hypothetical protein BJX70DRAFT_410130 [Aspergillus crustosus]
MTPPTVPKSFYIFGQNISFSISPTIHNTGFRHHNLPHTYSIHEISSIDTILPLIHDPSFGGASVTMPHKLHVSRFCTKISETARAIGAINTLVVEETVSDIGERSRVIRGENTDWSGLHSIISKYQTKSESQSGEAVKTGLVIGAGGASRAALYALYKAGIEQIYIVNRTLSTAERVRDHYHRLFPITVLPDLSCLPTKPEIIIGTIPAETTTETQFQSLFSGHGCGLCIDMSYKPRQTPLLSAAERCQGWETVTGVEVLLAQAFDQYTLWTGLEPPKREMIEVVEGREGSKVLRGVL